MTLQTIEPQSPFDSDKGSSDGAEGGRLPRPLLLGCGILLLLLGIGLVAFLIKGEAVMRHLLAWSLESVESQTMTNLPADLSPSEQQRLQRAFDAAEASMREEKSLDVAALQSLQPQLLEVSRSLGKGSLTRQQCLDLTAALEGLAGVETPREGPTRPQEEKPVTERLDAALWSTRSPPRWILDLPAEVRAG